jgi:hypothetical protein
MIKKLFFSEFLEKAYCIWTETLIIGFWKLLQTVADVFVLNLAPKTRRQLNFFVFQIPRKRKNLNLICREKKLGGEIDSLWARD